MKQFRNRLISSALVALAFTIPIFIKMRDIVFEKRLVFGVAIFVFIFGVSRFMMYLEWGPCPIDNDERR